MTQDEAGQPAILISGGAGYIGSHVAQAVKVAGFRPVIVDSLVNGHRWAVPSGAAFYGCDVADTAQIQDICDRHGPVAAMHFAAFIEVGESVSDPQKYFFNNRDKAQVFFRTLSEKGVGKIVFSSTAAVYGEPEGTGPLMEDAPTKPINPYGQSKLDAEAGLRGLPVRSIILRYFNVAGAGDGIGEAHFPETHLLPRIVLPLIDAPEDVRAALGLGQGFKIYGDDYPTPDGTAIRDYVHVLDLADAHVRALQHLLAGRGSDIINLGSSKGYSVREIVRETGSVLGRPDFDPPVMPRRAGDPPSLTASNAKAREILGWHPQRGIAQMVRSAAAWHGSELYRSTVLAKAAAKKVSSS